MKRLFFSINPSEDIRNSVFNILKEKEELFPSGCVKWVKKENIHITLLFLGLLREENMEKISLAATEALEGVDTFTVNFHRVCYHPPKKVPHLIWMEGESCPELSSLREDLKSSLQETGLKFIPENSFLPHITLGRIKAWEFKRMEREEIPEVEEEVSLSFPVESISLMESVLKKSSPDYNILKSFSL